MSVEIAFPVEFIVPGTPVSRQVKRPESKAARQACVKQASYAALPEGHFCTQSPVSVTLFYCPATGMQGDIDNIVKPILDALCHHIYHDDHQVEPVWVQKFEPGRVFQFTNPSKTLSASARPRKAATFYPSWRRSFGRPGMMSAHAQHEAAVLETILPQLEAEGFAVFIHPARSMLPPFLSTYQPDAVAIKPDRKIAIEIATAGKQTESKVAHLHAMFSEHPDWEFRIVYAPPDRPEDVIPAASRQSIEQHLDRIENAFDAMGATAALLTAWATFEAAARTLLPASFGKPQIPVRLLEALAADGFITPDEADALRQLGHMRNAVAHGQLDIVPARTDVERVIQVTRSLLSIEA